MNALIEKVYSIPKPIIILLLSLLVYLGHEATIVWDMSWYMVRGLNILNGLGYVGTDQIIHADSMARGPVFPMLLSVFLWFNKTPEMAFWVVRIFAIMAPILIYYLCSAFCPKEDKGKTGLIASLLYISYWAPNYASLRHLDAIWPCLVLLSMLTCLHGMKSDKWKEKTLFIILTGLLLSISYLTKEASIIFFSIPGAIWFLLPEYRNRIGFIYASLTTIFACIFLIPWFQYVYLETGEIPLLGKIGEWVLNFYSGTDSRSSPVSFLKGVQLIFFGGNNSLFHVFSIGFLFPIAWGVTAYLSIKYTKYRLVLYGLIAILPIVHFNAVQGWRIGHNIIFYIFSFISLSISLNAYFQKFFPINIKRIQIKFHVLIALFVIIGLLVPNLKGKTNLHFLSGSFMAQALSIKNKDRRGANHFKRSLYKEFEDYFENTSDLVTGILVDHPARNNALYFYLNGNTPSYFMDASYCYRSGIAGEGYKGAYESVEKPLFYDIKAHRWPPYPIISLFEKHLIAQIRNQNISHIVLTGGFQGIEDYFKKHPSFEEVLTNEKGKRSIWHVKNRDNLSSIHYKTIVSSKLIKNIEKISSNENNKYQEIMNVNQICYGETKGEDWFKSWFYK